MKFRILTITTILMVILSLSLAACGPQEEAPEAEVPEEEQAEEEVEEEAGCTNYVLVPKNLGNPYFDTGNVGAQEAAGELGITVLYQGSATADASEQITLLIP